MSSYKRGQDIPANKGADELSDREPSNDSNSTNKQIREYGRVVPSEERAGPSRGTDAEHPMIAAKYKSMHLTPVVESKNPPVRETKALLNLPVQTNKTFHKPYEPIAYSKGSRVYNSRATGSKPPKPRISKPQIPDTWGQEPTELHENDKTVARSTLRDHPYTPGKRRNHPTQSKKVLKEAVKPQKDMIKPRTGTGSTYFNNEVRISPEEEFNRLNEVIANKNRHQEEAPSSYVGQTTSIHEDGKQSVKIVSLHSGLNDPKMPANDDPIKNSVSRDLLVHESSVQVHTYAQGNASQYPSNTSNKSLVPQRSDQPAPKKITNVMRSLKLVSSHEKEVEPEAGPSNAQDLFVREIPESPDSFNKLMPPTGRTDSSEMPDVGSCHANTSHEEGASLHKIAEIDSQVLPSAYSPLEHLEEGLCNLSEHFVSSRNADGVSLKKYGTPWSPRQGSVISSAHGVLVKELSTSLASNPSITKLSNESSKLLSISTNSTSITKSTISIAGSELPSFVPTSATPVPQKIPRLSRIESEERVPSSEVVLTITNNLAEEEQTVIDMNGLRIRQEVPHFRTRQETSTYLSFPNPLITTTRSSAFRLNSLEEGNMYFRLFFCDVANQCLQNISNSSFLHCFIPTTTAPLYIPSNKHTQKFISFDNLLRTVISWVTGTSGLMLFTTIRNRVWTSSGETADSEANPLWYYMNREYCVDGDAIFTISSMMEDFMKLVLHEHRNNPLRSLSTNYATYEITLQNPFYADANRQMKSIHLFEDGVPLFEAMWIEANHPIVRPYEILENWFRYILRTVELTSPVGTIPQILGAARDLRLVTPIFKAMLENCYALKTSDTVTGAELDILGNLGSMLHVKLTGEPLQLMETPTATLVEQRWQLRCDSIIFMIHDAVNLSLDLLLGQRLARFFHFMAEHENGRQAHREYVRTDREKIF